MRRKIHHRRRIIWNICSRSSLTQEGHVQHHQSTVSSQFGGVEACLTGYSEALGWVNEGVGQAMRWVGA